ncbi:MAG: nitrilase-related carbon-nitrogen hydrolase, partial [Bacteroidota bacterium]
MRFALAQLNPIVGDLAGNAEKIVRFTQQAKEAGADLVIFPELIVTGYPPMDLLDRPAFLDAVEETVEWLVRELPEGPAVIIGTPVRNRGRSGKRLYNAALLIDQGSVQATILKRLLPTYDVFDEYRYFEPGPPTQPVEWRGLRLGLHICEDMWNNEAFAPFLLYDDNPIDDLAAQGIDVFVNISASPFERGKQAVRTRILRESCCEHDVPFVVVNQTGANTEVVFDGDSRVHGRHGELLLTTPLFEETLAFWDMDAPAPAEPLADDEDELAQVHAALVCGIRDYYHKTGFFDGVLLGLSGGIDSALTAALAVEALGPEHVMGITMPSKYSSSGSVDDSQALADALGIRLEHVSIRPAV